MNFMKCTLPDLPKSHVGQEMKTKGRDLFSLNEVNTGQVMKNKGKGMLKRSTGGQCGFLI